MQQRQDFGVQVNFGGNVVDLDVDQADGDRGVEVDVRVLGQDQVAVIRGVGCLVDGGLGVAAVGEAVAYVAVFCLLGIVRFLSEGAERETGEGEEECGGSEEGEGHFVDGSRCGGCVEVG